MVTIHFPVFPERDFTVVSDTLEGVDLSNAILHRADISCQVLRRANLSGADLNGADFSNTDLSWANLDNSIIINTLFHGACLNGATLVNAKIASLLVEVDMRCAVLKDAQISLGTDFSRALLHGADMRCYGIQCAVLTDARYDQKTKWPLFFNPRKRGAILERISPI